jgi:hypothetical protein
MLYQYNNTFRRAKISTSRTLSNPLIKRNMRSSRQLRSTVYNGITRKAHTALEPTGRNYATYKIQTPEPTKSALESLENNPLITLFCKNGSKVIQHGEVLEIFCDQPGCSGKLCIGLCGVPKGTPKIIGHVSHSEEYGTAKIGDTDLEDEKKAQFMKRYNKPYDSLEENSKDPQADEERTKKFLALLKKIENDAKNDT